MEMPSSVMFFPPRGAMLFRCVPCLLLILLSSLKATRRLLEMVAEQWLCPYTGLGDVTLPLTVSGVFLQEDPCRCAGPRQTLTYPQLPVHRTG